MPHWSRRDVLGAGLAAATSAGLALPLRAEELVSEAGADSLESLAHAKGLHFGTALGSRGLADPRYLELVRSQCGVVVPENALKMPAIQPAPGEFHFERAEALLAFAETNKLLTRGHCLLWHHPRWLPKWLDGYDFGAEPAKAAEKLLTDHISDDHHAFRQTHRVLGRGERSRRQRHGRDARDAAVEGDGFARHRAADGVPRRARRVARNRTRLQRLHGLGDRTAPRIATAYCACSNASAKPACRSTRSAFRRTSARATRTAMPSRVFDARDEKAWRKFLEDVTGMGYALADHGVRRARRDAARRISSRATNRSRRSAAPSSISRCRSNR